MRKAPFRRALNRLADALDQQYIAAVKPYIADPWELRNRYIHVMLGEIEPHALIDEMAGRILPPEAVRTISLLLEAQRERQRMFTSCGWFFDDFDRIEPKNNVAYATQAVLLTYLATGLQLAPTVLAWLREVQSWRTGMRADHVFDAFVRRGWNLRAAPAAQAQRPILA